MKNAETIELNAGTPGRAAAVEARRWIERQLQWERTLGSLRGVTIDESAQKAA